MCIRDSTRGTCTPGGWSPASAAQACTSCACCATPLPRLRCLLREESTVERRPHQLATTSCRG
eukprot:1236513-Pyramimonas_sp.AAC.1